GNPFTQQFPFVEEVLGDAFAEFGLDRLGGASSGRGWTSFSIYQRCPYAWKRRYIDQAQVIPVESPSRAIGTLVHAFLALYYTGMMDGAYQKLTPELVYERCVARANPVLVKEAWRVFTNYTIYYKHEVIQPLAVE